MLNRYINLSEQTVETMEKYYPATVFATVDNKKRVELAFSYGPNDYNDTVILHEKEEVDNLIKLLEHIRDNEM